MPNRFITMLILMVSVASSLIASAQPVIEGTWTTQADQYDLRIGQRYTFSFPAGGMVSDRIWGTGIYTADCSVASAAVHAGFISAGKGGIVTIEILPGQTSYEGSVQNGVSSFKWGSFNTSFVFVDPGRLGGTVSQHIIYGNWSAQATAYNGRVGQRYTFYFPPGGPVNGQVWGTGIYTLDCSVASAAVHAGIITTDRGGMVTIEILPGQPGYKGSVRNGVTSRDWGASYFSSFRFVQKPWVRNRF